MSIAIRSVPAPVFLDQYGRKRRFASPGGEAGQGPFLKLLVTQVE